MTDMKPVGSKFEYEEERNIDLMSVYHRLIGERPNIRLKEVMVELVNTPSRRFWVSEERASIVISAMMRGVQLGNVSPMKKEMFEEIYNRVLKIKKRKPSMSLFDMVVEVVNQPAPKFYLTPGSAKVIIHKIKKKWYEKRKQRLRHLF